MLTFSQRMGLKPVRSAIQVDSLDEETRNALWNVVFPYLNKLQVYRKVTTCSDIWVGLYHQPVDTVPSEMRRPHDYKVSNSELYCRYYRDVILNGNWSDCLELIEFMANEFNRKRWNDQGYDWNIKRYEVIAPSPEDYNYIFKKYLVGYRFVGDQLTQITNPSEILSVETAVKQSQPSVRELLGKALGFLSDRTSPDYAKSVDCSISAVESQCRILLGGTQASLGQALKLLEKKSFALHPALKDAFDKLFGYASNADGIRHGGINPADVDQALAQFMLVSCSAFVNYLISKGIDNSKQK